MRHVHYAEYWGELANVPSGIVNKEICVAAVRRRADNFDAVPHELRNGAKNAREFLSMEPPEEFRYAMPEAIKPPQTIAEVEEALEVWR